MRVLNNQQGVTLAELMISAAISTFIAMVAMLYLQSVTSLQLKAIKSDDIQSDLERFIFTLQNYTFYAVNVRYADPLTLPSLDGVEGPDGQGYVRTINISRQNDMGGKPSTTLMFFARENSRSRPNTAGLTSQFARTAVFYRARVDNVDPQLRRPPAILIHPGRNSNNLSAEDDEVIPFEYISDVQLFDPEVQYLDAPENLRIITSIRMTVKAIYPLITASHSPQALECYGPTGDIPTLCQNSRPYKVTQKSSVLYFPNNKRHTYNSRYEFTEGLYFFRPAVSN